MEKLHPNPDIQGQIDVFTKFLRRTTILNSNYQVSFRQIRADSGKAVFTNRNGKIISTARWQVNVNAHSIKASLYFGDRLAIEENLDLFVNRVGQTTILGRS